MKKLFIFFLVLLASFSLTGCVDQPINKGLYAIITLPLMAAAVYFGSQAVKGYKDGRSTQQTTGGIVQSKIKTVPWGRVFFAVIFFLASLGSARWIYEENRVYDPKRDDPYPTAPAPDGRESAESQAKKADSISHLPK